MRQYDGVLGVAKLYLGPAAEAFLDRQLTAHLNTAPDNLAPQQLEELAKWCYVSGKLVMEEPKAREFSDKIKALKV